MNRRDCIVYFKKINALYFNIKYVRLIILNTRIKIWPPEGIIVGEVKGKRLLLDGYFLRSTHTPATKKCVIIHEMCHMYLPGTTYHPKKFVKLYVSVCKKENLEPGVNEVWRTKKGMIKAKDLL